MLFFITTSEDQNYSCISQSSDLHQESEEDSHGIQPYYYVKSMRGECTTLKDHMQLVHCAYTTHPSVTVYVAIFN